MIKKLINWAAPLIGLAAIAYAVVNRPGANAGPGVVLVGREQPEAIGLYAPHWRENYEPGFTGGIWEVTRVSDADTITVRQGSEERRIRFCGIDAPESDQPGGDAATQFVKDAIAQGGGKVGLTFAEIDRYGRHIAEVWSAPGQFEESLLNSLLIASGHAWPYKQYWNNCPNLSALKASEESAEEYGTAIWKKPGAIAPWDWRRQKR